LSFDFKGLTGVFTGDIYKDPSLAENFRGSKLDAEKVSTFVIKTHNPEVVLSDIQYAKIEPKLRDWPN